MDKSQDHIVIFALNKQGQWAGEKWYTGSFLDPSQWGRMVGETFRSDYKSKMDALRETDDKIREWSEDLNKIVKKMRKANNSNRIMDVAILLSELNNRLKSIEGESNKLEELNETGLKELEDSLLENESSYEEDLDIDLLKGLESHAQFEWLKNWKKKWDTATLEKKYRKERRMAINKLIDTANSAVQNVQKMLKDLSKQRKAGDIDKYIKTLSNISKEQNKFKTNFVPVYNTYLKPVVEKTLNVKKTDEEEREKSVQESLEAEKKRIEELEPPAPETEKEREERADEEFRKELGDLDEEVTPEEVEEISEDLDLPDIHVEEEGGQQLMPWGVGEIPQDLEPETNEEGEAEVPTSQLGFDFSETEKEVSPENQKEVSPGKQKEVQDIINRMEKKRRERGKGKMPKAKQWKEWQESGKGWQIPEGSSTQLQPFEEDILDPKAKESRVGFEGRIPEAWRDMPKWPEAGAEKQRPPWHGTGLGSPVKGKEWQPPEPKEVKPFEGDLTTEPMETESSLEKALLKKQHTEFMSELQKIASRHEDPYLVAKMLLKYAEAIEDKDLETSLKLIAIAEGMDGDK